MSAPAKALLVAAGLGTRLHPLTQVLPKCLMPIAGRPLLGLWLAMLRDAGVSEIVVNLHHHADLVSEYIRRSPWAEHVVLAPEETLLGTGGTLLRHRERLAGGPTLFAHADNLSLFEPRDFLAGACGTAARLRDDDDELRHRSSAELRHRHAGRRRPRAADGREAAAAEGRPRQCGGLCDRAGGDRFIASLGRPVVDFSTEVLPVFMGRIFSFHNADYHRDIGTPASLALAQLDYPLAAGQFAASPVIARSAATKQSRAQCTGLWIASLRSQ